MEIPGYQWDPEKKRYFKVLKTGQLPGGDYTISALAEKERKKRRKAAFQRAELEEEETGRYARPQNVFEYKKLGKRSTNVYSGASDEIISSVFMTESGKLMTGGRNGVVSIAGRKSSQGRSIVGISEILDTPVVAAVDNECGSIVASSSASVQLPHEFVTSLCSVERSMLLGSQRGITVWDLGAEAKDVFPIGSVNALTEFQNQSALVGHKSGEIQILDLRTDELNSIAQFHNNRAITNMGSLQDPASVVATGLEDEMWLYDLRNGSHPVHEFADYKNWSTISHGFTMNEAKTAVAVVMDTSEINIYDIVTGSLLGPVQYTNKDAHPRIVPPSLIWPSQGLFVPCMNNVKAMISHKTRPGSGDPVWASEDDTRSIAAIHKSLNSQVVMY